MSQVPKYLKYVRERRSSGVVSEKTQVSAPFAGGYESCDPKNLSIGGFGGVWVGAKVRNESNSSVCRICGLGRIPKY